MKLTEENYVGIAEQAIKELCSEKDQKGRLVGPVTTSKIRNLLSMTSDIYNDVVNSQSDQAECRNNWTDQLHEDSFYL